MTSDFSPIFGALDFTGPALFTTQKEMDAYRHWIKNASMEDRTLLLERIIEAESFYARRSHRAKSPAASASPLSLTTQASHPVMTSPVKLNAPHSLMHRMLLQGTHELLELYIPIHLSKGGSVDDLNDKEQTPLMALASQDHFKVSKAFMKKTVDLLIQHGASLTVTDRYGRHLLHQAAKHQNMPLVKACVNAGCDLNRVDAGLGQSSLLAYLASFSHLGGFDGGSSKAIKEVESSVTYFLDKGSDVNAQSKWGEGIAHFLVTWCPHVDLQRTLLDLSAARGLNLNLQNQKGRTAFHELVLTRARFEAKLPLLQRFLELGANPMICDHSGQHAFHVIRQLPDPNERDQLEMAFADYEKRQITAAINSAMPISSQEVHQRSADDQGINPADGLAQVTKTQAHQKRPKWL